MIIKRPSVKPDSAFFSSGPCAKRPGWSISNLPTFTLGRSHRSKIAKDKLKELITLSKSLLKLPNDYKVGIVAGSDTGAIEMAMWSLLGATGVDILGWENFGNDWVKDAVSQLKIKNLNVHKADYGKRCWTLICRGELLLSHGAAGRAFWGSRMDANARG